MQIPAEPRRQYSSWSWSVLRQTAPRQVTWRLRGDGGRVLYLKTAPVSSAAPLPGEASRMRWAAEHGLGVPEVIAAGTEGGLDWLLTAELPGQPASDPALRADPGRLVKLLAASLRRFHAAPVLACPFRSWLPDAIAVAAGRVRTGQVTAQDLKGEHAYLAPAGALADLLQLRPYREDLVACHGNYRLRSVLIDQQATTGFVGLGRLGVADRWRDLALATRSVAWHLGAGWDSVFLGAYGTPPDDRRMAFYRLLHDLGA